MFSALVERAFLRIGSTDSDEQLENALSKFLPPILLKLSSSQEGVRKKVTATSHAGLSLPMCFIRLDGSVISTYSGFVSPMFITFGKSASFLFGLC